MAAAEFSYRTGSGAGAALSESENEDSSSEDEAGTWKRKRPRQFGVQDMDAKETFQNPLHSGGQSLRGPFKQNNVWGDVVSEQTMNQDLSSFGVDNETDVSHTVSRDVETYKVNKDMLELAGQECEVDSDGVMDDDGKTKKDTDEEDIFETKIFDKKSVKDRLGYVSSSRQYRDFDNVDGDGVPVDHHKHRYDWKKGSEKAKCEQNEDFSSLLQRYQKERDAIKIGEKRKRERKKRFGTDIDIREKEQVEKMDDAPVVTRVTVDDEPEVILQHVLRGLNEDNKTLFAKILDVAGKEKMLDVYSKTRDIEEVGGMMTLDGQRRRTAGGVFIQLIKSDKDLTKPQLDDLFAESMREWRRKRATAKKAHKKHQNEQAYKDLKASMMAPGMKDTYRKLLDDQLTSYKSRQRKPCKESLADEVVKEEVNSGKEDHEESMESSEVVLPAVATGTPPPSPEEGSEEGEILD